MRNTYAEKMAIRENVWREQGNLQFFRFLDTLFKPVWVALLRIGPTPFLLIELTFLLTQVAPNKF